MADFLQAINFVLDNEGGYSNHPSDPGGATNFGILQRNWPEVDIATLTRAQAITWYEPNYWDKAPYVGITSQQVATKLFDMHVNLGLTPAVLIAQKALGFSEPNIDGDMGPLTLAAINAADQAKFLAELTSLMTLHYKLLEERSPALSVFDGGWTARAAKLPPSDPAQNAVVAA